MPAQPGRPLISPLPLHRLLGRPQCCRSGALELIRCPQAPNNDHRQHPGSWYAAQPHWRKLHLAPQLALFLGSRGTRVPLVYRSSLRRDPVLFKKKHTTAPGPDHPARLRFIVTHTLTASPRLPLIAPAQNPQLPGDATPLPCSWSRRGHSRRTSWTRSDATAARTRVEEA